MKNYSFEDIKKLSKKFTGTRFVDDTWLDDSAEDFYEILKALELEEGNRVLYVGTGSGYGTYTTSNIVGKRGEVYSYEINKDEMKRAKENIERAKENDNINLIIGDCLSQPHKKDYFDRILFAAGGRLEIPKKDNQTIMKKDIKKNGLLEHMVRQTKIEGIIVLPMGELHTRWYPECFAHVYKIRNFNDYLEISTVKQKGLSIWTPLVGKYGFSREEMEENLRKEGSFFDDFL